MSKSLQWTMKVEEQEVGTAAGDVAVVTSVAGAIKMDPGFKLFGKTIAVASAAAVYAFSDAGADAGALFGKRAVHGATAPICSQKNGCAGSSIALTEVEQNLDDLRSSSGSDSGMDNNSNPVLKTRCGLGHSGAETYKDLARSLDQAVTTHTTEEEGEADDKTQQKQLEKIVTCPRCDSLDTKFCYYNNYNINQPRHFCKNCQRYWTAGGTLRNVPVGAGRRKNKHNGAHGPLQSSSEGEMVESVCQQQVQIDLSDGRQEQASQKALPLKIPQPRHLGQMADRSSPPLLSSPGGSTDSCLTVNMSSPFSLHLSGPVSCHTFASTHNKMSFQSASDEMGMKLSSDSPTRLGQKIKPPCSMNGALSSGEITAGPDMVDSGKEDAASSLTGPVHTVIRDGHGFQHQISSAMYNQSMPAGDLGGWTSNGSPFSFFSGAWPYGYNVAWNGVPPMPSTSPFCTPTPGSLGCSPPGPNFASWCPAPETLWTGAHWAPGIPGTSGVSGVVSDTNRSFAVRDAASKVPGVMTVSGTSGVPWDPQVWSLPTPGATAGKRVSPEGGKAESIWGQKLMRVDYDNKSSGWSNRVGIKSDPDVIDTGNLFKGFHPKIENQSTISTPYYKPHVFMNTMQFQETTT